MPQARSGGSRGSGSGGGSRRSSSSRRSGSSGGKRTTSSSRSSSSGSSSSRSSSSRSSAGRSSSGRSSSGRSSSSRSRSSGASRSGSTRATAADARFEDVAKRIRRLNDRIIEAGKEAGETTLTSYERVLKTIASAIQRGPGASDVEWISSLANAQAKFLRDMTTSWTSAARKALK